MSEKIDPFWTEILTNIMAENNDKDVANGHHLNHKNEQQSPIGRKRKTPTRIEDQNDPLYFHPKEPIDPFEISQFPLEIKCPNCRTLVMSRVSIEFNRGGIGKWFCCL